MEGESLGNGTGGSRWNPTKEQIDMLESLYRQGLRTPTAEQIQQITGRLRTFGHIEGKNVFYWFQNHKARLRQKQKQDNLAYFNRFVNAAPVFPQYQNVMCSPPCYLPRPQMNDFGFYQHYPPKVPLPAAGGFKRRLIPPENHCQKYNRSMHDQISSTKNQETLDLFPIHPTGILQAKNEIYHNLENDNSPASSSSENDCCISFF